MNAPPPNPLLYETLDNPLLAQVLEGPTDSLARATRPAFLDNPASPVTWSSPEFERLEAEREDLLNWDAVEALGVPILDLDLVRPEQPGRHAPQELAEALLSLA